MKRLPGAISPRPPGRVPGCLRPPAAHAMLSKAEVRRRGRLPVANCNDLTKQTFASPLDNLPPKGHRATLAC